MADVKIRNLDDRDHEAYRAMAAGAGLGHEVQLRRVLPRFRSRSGTIYNIVSMSRAPNAWEKR
jgi:plasmid stability protein